MKATLIECSCGSIEHIMKLTYFTNERDWLYVEYHLQTWPFFRRLWCGIKYILGFKSKYGDFGEALWDRQIVAQVRDSINDFLKEPEVKKSLEELLKESK